MPRRRDTVPENWFETVEDRVWLPPDDQGKEEAQLIRRLLKLRRGQRVLDAPCGAGRIAYHIARAGLDVEGLDIRDQFLSRARRRFRKAGLQGRFRIQDLRSFRSAPCFHGIYTWFGSFGYFSEAENVDLIRRFAGALLPGGRLLIEQVNRERILRNFRRKGVVGPIVSYAYWNPTTERAINHRVVDGIRDAANSSSMRLYTPRQLSSLFEAAGLETTEATGYPGGHSLTRGSRRMVIVGRKPRRPVRQSERPEVIP